MVLLMKNERLSRRSFVKLLSSTFVLPATNGSTQDPSSEKEFLEPTSPEQKPPYLPWQQPEQQGESNDSSPPASSPMDGATFDDAQEVKPELDTYLEEIVPDQEQILTNVTNYPTPILRGIKDLSKERELEEISRYFPLYRAAEITYNIPWSLLMIIHAHETTFSSDPHTNNRSFTGAMQRAVSWPESQTIAAAEGWDFLANIPQRIPTDYREILWAGSYIRRVAQQRYPTLLEEDSYLATVKNNYSAQVAGIARVVKYQELKPLLQITE